MDTVTALKCFVAGTMITTAAGVAAIENTKLGDMVLTANEETGEVAYKKVVRTFVNATDEITHVTIENAKDEQEIIASTLQHPFYVEGKGWVEANSLHAGMRQFGARVFLKNLLKQLILLFTWLRNNMVI